MNDYQELKNIKKWRHIFNIFIKREPTFEDFFTGLQTSFMKKLRKKYA